MDLTEAVDIKKRWQKYTEELYQKSLCITKETINKVKRQPSEWEKTITNEATDKQVISKKKKKQTNKKKQKQKNKQHLQCNSRRINNPIQEMGQRTK